jgi:hypothetical protein
LLQLPVHAGPVLPPVVLRLEAEARVPDGARQRSGRSPGITSPGS